MAKKSSFIQDFKKFISKGNIIDLAVAVVIGSAFSAIVTSVVNGIIMPLISLLTGRINFNDLKWVITPADEEAGTVENALLYGTVIQNIINFLIVAFCIFCVLRIIMKAKKKINEKEEAEAAAKAAEEKAKADEAAAKAAEEEARLLAAEEKMKEDVAKQTELLERLCAIMEKK
ncbi:MAG: large conductance mechanosensitive channel protein MscL [Clostridia bacterium]|nr:large conductance mechanosensitive channel protein MscL [Clostridia bacterium]